MFNVENKKRPLFRGVSSKRKIKCTAEISKADKEGIISFYEALVSRKEIKKMRIDIIRKHFPTFEDIDIDMIYEKAFPEFERTIGKENFTKVKQYFGIGCKKKKIDSTEIESLLCKLRSIENAQYYICGFSDLLTKFANFLDVEEDFTDIVKAKIVRMYAILFFSYIYFVEDLGYGGRVNDEMLEKNNKFGFYPEELFILYASRFSELPEKSIFYDSICFELSQIDDKKLLKEILEFSELDFSANKFTSVNIANPYQTFGKVRKLKQDIHIEPSISPLEYLSITNMINKLDIADVYVLYKKLINCELADLNKIERTIERFEGSRLLKCKYNCYEVVPERLISGEREKNRIIKLVEILCSKNFTMSLKSDLITGEDTEKEKVYHLREFFGAIKFVKDAYSITGTTIVRDFEIVDELIKKAKRKKILSKYYQGTASIEEVKEALGIDETFEVEFLGIKPEINLTEVISNFAIKNGYVESKKEINVELIEDVILPGNEELIKRYHEGEFNDEKFERKLGLDSEFAEMFFNLSKVNIELIEERLLEVKKTSSGKRKMDNCYKMIVLLYIYLVEGQIPCGPKNRTPKRNKGLKTSILKDII